MVIDCHCHIYTFIAKIRESLFSFLNIHLVINIQEALNNQGNAEQHKVPKVLYY